MLDLTLQTLPKARVTSEECPGFGRQPGAAALVATTLTLHEAVSERALGVDQVGQRMAIRPSDMVGRSPDGPRRADRAKEADAAIPESKARSGVEPYLVLNP